MKFTHYRNLGEVIKSLSLQYRQKMRLETIGKEGVCPPSLQEWLDFVVGGVAYNNSESAICENLIYPVLVEVWKSHIDSLSLWSNPDIGTAESSGLGFRYVVSRKSPYGKIVMESPYLIVIEPKLHNFQEGWMQCTEKMHKLQQLNGESGLTIFGIVTNGEIWEFARLEQNVFTQYTQRHDIGEIDRLFHALTSIFGICKKQLTSPLFQAYLNKTDTPAFTSGIELPNLKL